MSRTHTNTIVRRFLSSNNNSGPVTAAYLRQVEAGAVRRDASQIALATKLDILHGELKLASLQLPRSNNKAQQLRTDYLKLSSPHQDASNNVQDLTRSIIKTIVSAKRRLQSFFFAPPKIPQGMYIHGSVGVGKSFLMDLFFDTLNHDDDIKTCIRNKRRVHFHEFMLHVHARMFEWKKAHPQKDVVPLVAMEMLNDGQVFVLCLDEFQVTDIADAMILKRLFDILFHVGGVVVVATSNRSPEDLYKGGINRSLFLPFIDTLKKQCHVVPMDTIHDYRRDTIESGTSYFFMSEDGNDGNHQESLEKIFGSADDAEASPKKEVIPVVFGRTVKVARANEKCAWFDFRELCQEPLGAADYIAICHRFPTLILDKVPPLGRANSYNEARRFVTLIDACYEWRTRLVIAAKVPLHDLFVDFDTTLIVDSTDGDEELKMTAVEPNLPSESWLSGKGGSSSSFSTTMIRTEDGGNIEWSATGRVGASLAQLSAVDDVSFSFKRAASRLVEMSGNNWAGKHK
jgi:protein AFG1